MQTLPEIKVRSLYHDANRPYKFELLESVTVTLSNGAAVTIPAGYITDFRSAPKNRLSRAIVNAVVNQVGNHNLAVLVHDWLYDNRLYSREFADREMAIFLLQIGCSMEKTVAMYYACQFWGQKWWDSDSIPAL